MYYNNERKERYIAEKEASTMLPENYLERLFKSTSEFEEKYNKDICDFTVNEITDYYKNLNSASTGRLAFTNSSLRQYTQWCLNQSLVTDSQNHFEEFNHEKYQECINLAAFSSSIISKEMIDEWIGLLCNPCDQFLIEAIYEGISGKELRELANLRITDFDLDNQTVTLHNEDEKRTIPVSKQLCRLAVESANECYFYPNNGTGSTAGDEVKYLPDPDLILKNHPNVDLSASSFQVGRRLKNKLLRIGKYADASFISVMALTTSGKINFIKERCKKLGISGEEFLFSDHIKELDKQFNCTTKRSTFYNNYGSYLPK